MQGFPRADIDVAGLRADRQRILGKLSLGLRDWLQACPPQLSNCCCIGAACIILRAPSRNNVSCTMVDEYGSVHSSLSSNQLVSADQSSLQGKEVAEPVLAHAVLSNDHKAVTARIDGLLQQLHADARSNKTASGATNMDTSTLSSTTAAAARSDSSKRPFADLSQVPHQVTATSAANAPAASKVSNSIRSTVIH